MKKKLPFKSTVFYRYASDPGDDVVQKTVSANSGEEYVNYLKEKQKERVMPFSITFELTPLCNFRCKMCYIRLDREQLESSGNILLTDEWIQIAKQAQYAGVFKVTFTGGEVFTHPEFQRIYETVYDMGFHISIISNGYLINDKALEWLCKRKPDFIKVTIYGANDETYKRVCGIDCGFTIVTSNIERILARGISVVTCMTVIEDNCQDIEQVRAWTDSHNLRFICSKVIRKKNGNANSCPESVRLHFDYDSDIDAKTIKHAADMYPMKSDSPFELCLGYHNSCIICWDGIVKGCNFINSFTSNIRKKCLIDCFKELWTGLDRIRIPNQCTSCRYLRFCNPCPGKLEGESGNPEVVSKYVCDLAKWCYSNLNIDKNTEYTNDPNQCE